MIFGQLNGQFLLALATKLAIMGATNTNKGSAQMTTQYAYRDQAALTRLLGLSVKETADFTPHGCLAIISQLEAFPGKNLAISALLTAERRGFCALYSSAKIIPFPALRPVEHNPRLDSERKMEFRAMRAFGG